MDYTLFLSHFSFFSGGWGGWDFTSLSFPLSPLLFLQFLCESWREWNEKDMLTFHWMAVSDFRWDAVHKRPCFSFDLKAYLPAVPVKEPATINNPTFPNKYSTVWAVLWLHVFLKTLWWVSSWYAFLPELKVYLHLKTSTKTHFMISQTFTSNRSFSALNWLKPLYLLLQFTVYILLFYYWPLCLCYIVCTCIRRFMGYIF